MANASVGARVQRTWLRRLQHLLIGVLLLTALTAAVIALHLGPSLVAALSPQDLTLVLKVLSVLVLLLIPISGIVSTTSQFAYWNGWLEGLPQPEALFADAPTPSDKRCTVVYLDGIHQSERDHPPRVTGFLNELERRLPVDAQLLRGLETYTVSPARLADDTWGQWFWRRLFALQEHHPNSLVSFVCAFLVQANNVIKVGISSDRRYGPVLNYELALKVCTKLNRLGFVPGPCNAAGPQELVLLGYSGGSEMAMGMAEYLRRLCHCPVRIISFCGVFSGNQLLEQVGSIAMVVGSRDPVAAFGRIAYPGRSPLLPLSNWNRAVRRQQVQRLKVDGMNHNGSCGPFSSRYRSAVIDRILESLQALNQGKGADARQAGP